MEQPDKTISQLLAKCLCLEISTLIFILKLQACYHFPFSFAYPFCFGVFADVSGGEVTNTDTVNSNITVIGLMKLSNKMLSVCLMMLQ